MPVTEVKLSCGKRLMVASGRTGSVKVKRISDGDWVRLAPGVGSSFRG